MASSCHPSARHQVCLLFCCSLCALPGCFPLSLCSPHFHATHASPTTIAGHWATLRGSRVLTMAAVPIVAKQTGQGCAAHPWPLPRRSHDKQAMTEQPKRAKVALVMVAYPLSEGHASPTAQWLPMPARIGLVEKPCQQEGRGTRFGPCAKQPEQGTQ